MIKLLYVNGDSFSFGEELGYESPETRFDFTEYKRKHCYSGILADHYKIENYINNSRPGGSNQRVYRTLINDISKLLNEYNPNEIFVNVSLTSPTRTEFYYKDGNQYHDFLMGYPPNDKGAFFALWKAMFNGYSSDYSWYNFDIMLILSIQNFLKVNKIPYLLTSSLSTYIDKKLRETHVDFNLINQLDNLRYYAEPSFMVYTNKLPVGKNLHPLEEGHRSWAEHLLELIENRNLFRNNNL